MAKSAFGHALFYSGVSGFSGSTGGSAPANPPYVGHFDRDIAGSTGSVSYTGVGFKPAMVQIFWVDNGTARSGMYQTNQNIINLYPSGIDTATTYTAAWYRTAIIDLYQGADRQYGYITSLDSDGFTMSWTKVGSPTGTLACTYVAYPDLSVGISGTSGYSGQSGATITENSITGATTLTATAFGKQHVCSGTSSDYTVGLPAASGHAGEFIKFRMAPGLTKLVTLDGNSSETIDGATTRIMWAGEAATLYCDGSNWFKTDGKTIPMVAGQYKNGGGQVVSTGPNRVKLILGSIMESNCPSDMNDTTNSRVVIVRPGIYHCYAKSRLQNVTASGVMETFLYRGASEEAAVQSRYATLNDYPGASTERLLSMSVSGYLEVKVQHWFGSNQTYFNDATNSITVIEIPNW